MNRDTLTEKLKNDIAAGRVVMVAGTGVSVAACNNQEVEGCKVATWSGLLQHGVKHCREIGVADECDADLLVLQIKSGKTDFLVNAAETVSQRMKGKSEGVFRGWLKETVGKLRVKNRAVIDALAPLPGVLATLNYDNLLEEASGRRAVTWLKSDDVQEVLTCAGNDAVLHLHGWFKEPESVVLGLSSYNSVKDHPHAKSVLQLFTIDRTLLFVGCGDTVLDPNFTRLIEWGKEALKDVAPRHYLLCRTSEIPEFQKKLAGAPWLQPLDYGADHTDLVPFLHRLVPAGRVPTSLKSQVASGPGVDLAAYRQAMRKRYSRLKIEELDPTTYDVRPLTLTGMFIAQSARECAEFMPRVFELPKELQQRLRESGEMEGGELDEEILNENRRAYLDQSPRPILEIVDDPALSRLVVLGDPGSGKSTLLQYLLLRWAEQTTPVPAGHPLPLLIELREYARLRQEGQSDGFLVFLHRGTCVRWHFDQARLDGWLKNNPSLVLFDGLDEVFDRTLRREIATAIHRFADVYPQARVIVTSRIIGYQHQSWRDENFRHFMLQELDEDQIADFFSRWHRYAYEESAKGEAKRALLVRAIEDSTAIRQLAGNPLLLTMMAILNRTQDLPRDRAELYEQCARLLLHQWKVEAAFATDPELAKASLDFKDKRGLLLRVAHAIQTSEHGLSGNLIDEATLEGTLAEGLTGVPNLRPDRAARALIEQLRGRNFMLCSVGGHSYAFVHRTFLEYFCAVDIRERFQAEQSLTLEQLKANIFGHWTEEAWHEILCLLAGMLAPRFVAEILEWLIAQSDPEDTCYHVCLAARCVGEVRKRAELGAITDRVRNRVIELIHFDLPYYYDAWDNATADRVLRIRMHALREFARGWKDDPETLTWLKDRAKSDEDGFVRSIVVEQVAHGWKNDPETLPWLKKHARSDENRLVRTSAVEELAWGFKNDPETLAILKACATSDVHGSVRAYAVRELARGWKDAPETLTILKDHAMSNKSELVRASAVRELARGWRDDPETLTILKNRARLDQDEFVRQRAVRELARHWRDDPETPDILRFRAKFDSNWAVRQSAMEALARGWKDAPETLPWLKDRTQSDGNWTVRASAVRELARGWKDDPETLVWLNDRAKSDGHKDVRASAVRELARGWKDAPETLTILKDRARFDQDGFVRTSTAVELARGWKDDPETLAILKDHARSDENEDVRASAVRELARGWKNDPQILGWLKEHAQSDENEIVRQSAVQELARNWRDDLETLAILKTCAQSDENGAVRQSAARELARGWKDDPETLTILKAHAQSDENGTVRESAMEELARGWKDDPEVRKLLEKLKSKANRGQSRMAPDQAHTRESC